MFINRVVLVIYILKSLLDSCVLASVHVCLSVYECLHICVCVRACVRAFICRCRYRLHVCTTGICTSARPTHRNTQNVFRKTLHPVLLLIRTSLSQSSNKVLSYYSFHYCKIIAGMMSAFPSTFIGMTAG